MKTPGQHYQQILKTIDLYENQERNQFSFKEIAEKLKLSPTQFKQLFIDWAKVSPEEFFEYSAKTYTKELLRADLPTLFTTLEKYTVSNSYSYAPLVQIERMTTDEFKSKENSLAIEFSFTESFFGQLIIASSPTGICYMSFEENEKEAIQELQETFPNAQLQQKANSLHEKALTFFQSDKKAIRSIPLHLKGTDFQVRVWEAILKIPLGKVSTYGKIAEEIQQPKASRAVGTAIGSNLIAFIIPCHRVVQTSGDYGGFKWGRARKTMLLGWERARTQQ